MPLTWTKDDVRAAAIAIANLRGKRRGVPPIEMLEFLPPNLYEEVTEDARAALDAVSQQVEIEGPLLWWKKRIGPC